MIACQLGNYHIIQRLLEEPEVDANAVDNVRTPISFWMSWNILGVHRISGEIAGSGSDPDPAGSNISGSSSDADPDGSEVGSGKYWPDPQMYIVHNYDIKHHSIFTRDSRNCYSAS